MENNLELLTNFLWNRIPDLNEMQIALIRLYADDPDAECGTHEFLKNTTIEEFPFSYTCLLCRYFSARGWELAPDEIRERLRGVQKKLTAQNMVFMAEAFHLMSVFSANGITALFTENTAVKAAILSNIVQKLDEISFAIKPKDQPECEKILFANGYQLKNTWFDTYFYQKDFYQLRVDCRPLKSAKGKENAFETLLANASVAEKGQVNFLLPQPEDSFLMLMLSGADIYLRRDQKRGPCLWLANCVDMAKAQSIKYETVYEHAEQYGTVRRFQLALSIMKRFLPNFFSELYIYEDPSAVSGQFCSSVMRRFELLDRIPENDSKWSSFARSAQLRACNNNCLSHPEDDSSIVLEEAKAAARTIENKFKKHSKR